MHAMLQPSYFISHGGGPWPFVEGPMRTGHAALEAALRSLPGQLPTTPAAVLMISAHWESPGWFAVQSAERPAMLYDYSGFPPQTYQVRYPALGSPALAASIADMVEAAGLRCELDAQRGYDHGAFVPLSVMWPRAELPVLQLSLRADLDAAAHLRLGQAIAPLRERNVLVIGSGLSFHNMRLRGSSEATRASRRFDDWLGETLLDCAQPERAARLADWTRAPAARDAHPREEHLLPLMVALGSAIDEPAQRMHHETHWMGAVTVSSYRFGSP